MNARLALIRQQRAMLRCRADAQRLALAEAFRPWHRPLAIADLVVDGARQLRRYPWMMGVALMLLVAVPRTRAAVWVGRLLTAWKIIRVWRRPGTGRA